MQLKPKSDKCIFEPDTLNKGGLIVMPESSSQSGVVGTIMSVGPEVQHAKSGDRVIIARFAGFALEYAATQVGREYEKCRLIRELDILADITDASDKPKSKETK